MNSTLDLTLREGKAIHESIIACIASEEDENVIVSSFNKWYHDNIEGFYIRDLDLVVQIVNLVIDLLDRNFNLFRVVLDQLLEICSKPLMELKANERLSVKGLERIGNYFRNLSHLWGITDVRTKIKIGKCMRCIVNGGRDPSQLKCDYHEWQADGVRLKVTDVHFIHRMFRETEALDAVVYEFINATEILRYKPNEVPTITVNENDDDDASQHSFQPPVDDDLEMYGLPPRNKPEAEQQQQLNITVNNGDDNTLEYSLNKSPLEIKTNDSFDNNNFTNISPKDNNAAGGADSPSHASQSGSINKLRSRSNSKMSLTGGDNPSNTRDLSQIMLDLCLDLSKDAESAFHMCILGICDGIIILLDKDSKFNPREQRITYIVELMWNVLEHFMEHAKVAHGHNVEINREMLIKYQNMLDFGLAILILKNLINFTLLQGFRLSDKELRNELLIILTMLASFPCAVEYFLQYDMMNWCITYACIEEMNGGNNNDHESPYTYITPIANARNYATSSDIDMEFKKGLWFIINELLASNNPEALYLYSTSPLLLCMLAYLETDSYDPHAKKLLEAAAHHDHNTGNNDIHNSHSYLSQFNSVNLDPHEQQQQHPPHSGHLNHTAAGNNIQLSKSMSLIDDKNNITTGTQASPNNNPQNQTISHNNSATVKSKKGFISTLPLSKLREMQLLGMNFLVHNAPKVLAEFEYIDGTGRIIALTIKYCRSDVYEHKMLVFNGLILLNRCLNHSNTVRQFLEENNIIQTFLFILNKTEHEETKAQLIRLISTLCSGNNTFCQRQVRMLGGILDMINPLAHYVKNRKPLAGFKAGIDVRMNTNESDTLPDPLENPYGGEISILIVAILDCLNNVIVGNTSNESYFAEHEGIDALLDMCETSTFVLRLPVLRLLSDILRNRKLIPFVNAWRSPKTLRSAAQIFCHCWLDEEVRLNGLRDETGVVIDLDHPLGKDQHQIAFDDSIAHASIRSPTSKQQQQQQQSFDENNNNGDYTSNNGEGESKLNESSASLTALNQTLSKSVTVKKLANAILAGRNAAQTNLPIEICAQALCCDTRVILSNILEYIGVYEMYGIQDKNNMMAMKDSNIMNKSIYSPVNEEPTAGGMLSPQPNDNNNNNNGDGGVNNNNTNNNNNIFFNQQNNSYSEYKSFDITEDVTLFNKKQPAEFENSTATMITGTGGGQVFHSSGDLCLNPRDKQVLSIARSYQALREGEWWQDVNNNIQQNNVTPIEADLAYMESRVKYITDTSYAVQLEQMELYQEDQSLKKETEDNFIDQIITKKNQQIKAEWLKKNGKNKTMTAVSMKKKFTN